MLVLLQRESYKKTILHFLLFINKLLSYIIFAFDSTLSVHSIIIQQLYILIIKILYNIYIIFTTNPYSTVHYTRLIFMLCTTN